MPMYTARFYRIDDDAPYHTWAPFHAASDFEAEERILWALDKAARTPGATLSHADRYEYAPIDERTP